ncbi:MAG TPA: hypothetical protein VIY48_17290 [Candidatus Paceibacterota bacterium]
MSKFSKESVNYSRGMKDSHCGKVFSDDKGYCRHFSHLSVNEEGKMSGECQIVSGDINPIYWCKKFDKAKK